MWQTAKRMNTRKKRYKNWKVFSVFLLMPKLHRCWTCSNFKHSLSLHLKIQFISFLCCMCTIHSAILHSLQNSNHTFFLLFLLFFLTIEFLCMECTIIVWFNILECYPQRAIQKSIWNMLSNIIVNSIDFCWMRCWWFYHFSILIIYISLECWMVFTFCKIVKSFK